MGQTTRAVTTGPSQSPEIACAAARVYRALLCAGVLTLGACSVTPPTELDMVQVDAKKLSIEHSSFSAQLGGDDGGVTQTFATSIDPGLTRINAFTRLESSFTQRMNDDGETLRVGDAVSSVGMWGSSVRFGGMQFGTRSAARSDIVASSELATSGLAVLPTVADALFASIDSNSAPLASRNLSSARSVHGRGMGLSLTDALGRTQTIDAPMISGVRLVEQGCEDFSLGFGRVRRDYAIESNAYGPTFANTTVACGVPLGFTIEGHGEYLADEVTAFGIGVARKIGPLGTASFAVASSQSQLGSGWLARAGFEHQNAWFNVALRTRVQSRDFREINTLDLSDPIMQRDLASIGVNVGDGANLSLAYATQTTWARERADVLAVRQSMNVGAGSLSLSAGHSVVESIGSSLFISYQRPFGTQRGERSSVEEFDLDILTRPLTLTP